MYMFDYVHYCVINTKYTQGYPYENKREKEGQTVSSLYERGVVSDLSKWKKSIEFVP